MGACAPTGAEVGQKLSSGLSQVQKSQVKLSSPFPLLLRAACRADMHACCYWRMLTLGGSGGLCYPHVSYTYNVPICLSPQWRVVGGVYFALKMGSR